MGFIILIMAALIAYFIPSIIAKSNNHKNSDVIILVNLFFGWTFIGWFIALIWSVLK